MKKTTIIAIIAILGVAVFWGARMERKENNTLITIEKHNIAEENFSGSTVDIKGENSLAVAAKQFVDNEIANFRERANLEVPDIRKQFGDMPPSHYTIDITAEQLSGTRTETILIQEYVYTGGANGMSIYKAFTVEKATGTILALGDVIVSEKQDAFTQLVKDRLLAWKPEGMDSSPVFKDAVDKLSFSSFTNFGFKGDTFVLYFAKYDIGPGALGPVAFEIPVADLADYLSIY